MTEHALDGDGGSLRRCAQCGKPLRRWQRGCFHGLYEVVTPYRWENCLAERWQVSGVRRLWKRIAYGAET